MPTARMREKIKSERLLTTVKGSSAANAVVVKHSIRTTTVKMEKMRYARSFVLVEIWFFKVVTLLFFLKVLFRHCRKERLAAVDGLVVDIRSAAAIG